MQLVRPPYSRFVSHRSIQVAALIALAFVLANCGPDTPSIPARSSADSAFCGLVPVARQVAIDLRTTTDAARRRDTGSMTRAAMNAASGARRITDTLKGVSPHPPRSDPRFVASVHLVSIANFGQQFDILFESGEIPDARTLATIDTSVQLLAIEQQGLVDALAAADIEPC